MHRFFLGRRVWLILLVSLLLSPFSLNAADFDFSRFRRECGLRLAYGYSLHTADVKLFSLLPRYGFFLVQPGGPSWKGIGVSVVLEGVFSLAEAENTGSEFGVTPLLKLSLPLGGKILAFLEGGAGLILENFDSPTTGSTFNFTPQVGAGLDIALTPQLALTLAYRFRHSSNAGLYERNPGLDANFFHVGLTYYH